MIDPFEFEHLKSMPRPECEAGYTQLQLKRRFGVFDKDSKTWMNGRAQTTCDGRQ